MLTIFLQVAKFVDICWHMLTRQQAKDKLKTLGWSYRTVAPVLGVRQEHISHVLNGHRKSNRILLEIAKLPPSGRQWGKKEEAR